MLEYIESFKQRLKTRSTVLFALLVSIISLSACGGSDGDDEFKEAVKVNDLKITSITISSPNTISLPSVIEVEANEDFIAMAEIDSGASAALDISDQVRWSSSDSSIISISSSGRATGITDGTVEIRAELADLFDSKDLSASSAELTSIAISIDDALASIGVCTLHHKFTAMGTYEDGRVSDVTSNITWISSAENVVEVDSEGAVTALIVGDTVISAEHDNGVVSNNWPLAVIDTLQLITVTPESSTINEGETQQFIAMGSYSDLVDDQDITTTVVWMTENTDAGDTDHLSISNEESKEGLATAETAGDVEVTASCGADSTSVAVVIEAPVTLTDIAINGGAEFVRVDLTDLSEQLEANLVYSDGSNPKDVADDEDTTWSVTSGTATVTNQGKVFFTEKGTSIIKVFYIDSDGESFSDEIDVDVD